MAGHARENDHPEEKKKNHRRNAARTNQRSATIGEQDMAAEECWDGWRFGAATLRRSRSSRRYPLRSSSSWSSSSRGGDGEYRKFVWSSLLLLPVTVSKIS
mmetsp:Transcript_11677/g.27759  ORF Transcript_11677/g.27759 Transcript_11677/m.27759 type:complete len:101 (+) Transcript_11677:498-800(+)